MCETNYFSNSMPPFAVTARSCALPSWMMLSVICYLICNDSSEERWRSIRLRYVISSTSYNQKAVRLLIQFCIIPSGQEAAVHGTTRGSQERTCEEAEA